MLINIVLCQQKQLTVLTGSIRRTDILILKCFVLTELTHELEHILILFSVSKQSSMKMLLPDFNQLKDFVHKNVVKVLYLSLILLLTGVLVPVVVVRYFNSSNNNNNNSHMLKSTSEKLLQSDDKVNIISSKHDLISILQNHPEFNK